MREEEGGQNLVRGVESEGKKKRKSKKEGDKEGKQDCFYICEICI